MMQSEMRTHQMKRLKNASARTSGGEKVVLDTDPVPADLFAPRTFYTKINPGNHKTNEEIGVDRSGTRLTYSARVRDPANQVGLFRCAGS